MRYRNVIGGSFLDRPNRFIAHVETAAGTETVHVKKYRQVPGTAGAGSHGISGKRGQSARKTAYDLIAVEKGSRPDQYGRPGPQPVFAEWARCRPLFAGHPIPLAGSTGGGFPAGLLRGERPMEGIW